MPTRRTVLEGLSLSALAAGVTVSDNEPVYALNAELADLLKPGPLGDIWLGSPTAPITMIEYASLTCPHCAAFHRDTWPLLKERYVDTGRVRFTIREFPLDFIATAAFMVARCDGGAQYYQVIDLLLEQQPAWAFVKKSDSPIEAMAQTLQSIGITKAKFEICLRNGDTYAGINATKNKANSLFLIETTPSFFINTSLHVGEISISYVEKVVSFYLK